eukprot:712404-Rhodomonas_salina.4
MWGTDLAYSAMRRAVLTWRMVLPGAFTHLAIQQQPTSVIENSRVGGSYWPTRVLRAVRY